jgi:hypothetical protein
MAKKSKVNKSQVVRDYLAAHPDAMPKDVRAALAKEGIEVSRVLVSTIKSKLNKGGTGKKAAKKPATDLVAPPAVEKPTNGGITLEQVKKVAHMLSRLGGIQRVTEMLEVIKELGGVKKFKELAEAMSVTEADDIPF